MTTYRDILRNINEAVEKMNEKSGKILDIYYIDSFNKFNYVYMVDHDNDDLLFYGDEITKQQFDKTMKMAKNVKDVVKVNLIDLSGKSGKERDVIFNKYKNKINGKSSFVNKQFFSNESIKDSHIKLINENYDKNGIIFEKGVWGGGIFEGTWENGTWENGNWYNGEWKNGTWLKGMWRNGNWKNGTWKNGTWLKGMWFDGKWEGGKWEDGIWYDGIHSNGDWLNGVWTDGIWENGHFYKGKFSGGSWENGHFHGGIWHAKTWHDGEWSADAKSWSRGQWKNGRIYSNKFRDFVQSKINPKEFYEIEKDTTSISELEKRVK